MTFGPAQKYQRRQQKKVGKEVPLLYLSEQFLNGVWKDYSTQRLRSSNSKKRYLSVINNICNFCCLDFFALDTANAIRYKRHLDEKGYAQGTQDEHFRILKSIGSYIENNSSLYYPGYVSPFTFISFEEPTTFYDNCEIPEISIVDQMLQQATRQQKPFAFIAITLAFRCALLASEIIQLQRGHFIENEEEHSVSLMIPETPLISRHIPVPDDVVQCLKRLASSFWDGNSTQRLFQKRNGQPITLRTLQRSIQTVSNATGTHTTLREIRNLSILELLRSNRDYSNVAAFTGLDGRWLFRFERCLMERSLVEVNLPNIQVLAVPLAPLKKSITNKNSKEVLNK